MQEAGLYPYEGLSTNQGCLLFLWYAEGNLPSKKRKKSPDEGGSPSSVGYGEVD